MNTDQNIPKEDWILSQELQRYLYSDVAPPELNDPLANALFDFKWEEKQGLNDLEMNKIRVWNNIHTVINQTSKKESAGIEFLSATQLFKLNHVWKIAAVVFITFLATLFLSRYQEHSAIEIARANLTIETIILRDGSEATLRPNSVLYSLKDDDSIQSYRLDGEAIFSVVSNPERQFLVITDLGSVEVLGTRFNVRTWENEMAVYLESGSLRLSTTDQMKETLLKPGELSVITPQFKITDPKSIDQEYFTSWQMDEIVFMNRSAASLFREIEHHYSIDIQTPDEIKKTVLGGSISLQNLEKTLQNLGLVLEGEFILIEDNRYQFYGF